MLAASRGVDVPTDLHLKVGEGVSGRVAQSGDPVRGRVGKAPGELCPAAGEPADTSLIAVPLTSSGTVIGVLDLYGSPSPDGFDDNDLATIRTFASQATVAIDNVLLHEEAQRLSDHRRPDRAVELPLLHDDDRQGDRARRPVRPAVGAADARPRPVQGGQRHLTATSAATPSSSSSPGGSAARSATSTPSRGTAVRSSSWCCPRPTRPVRRRPPNASATRCAASLSVTPARSRGARHGVHRARRSSRRTARQPDSVLLAAPTRRSTRPRTSGRDTWRMTVVAGAAGGAAPH